VWDFAKTNLCLEDSGLSSVADLTYIYTELIGNDSDGKVMHFLIYDMHVIMGVH
jgi:hypothetical protein